MSGDDGGNLAVLIDADNVSYKVIAGLMAEVANYGTASVRRIYGDWTSPLIKQFAYTTGKNATDGAMIIDAMDLLFTGRFSSFCLVSSDSDFTRLASRIREQGITVYGFGNRNTTNNALVAACNKFVYFDALPILPEPPGPPLEPKDSEKASTIHNSTHNSFNAGSTQQAPVSQPPQSPGSLTSPSRYPLRSQHRRMLDDAALRALASAINTSAVYEDDYVHLAEVGIKLPRISPDLNPRNYGFERLRDFVEASGIVELKMKPMGPHPLIALVRLKGPPLASTSI